MNSYSIQQALSMSGQVIPRIVAKVTKVYERKTGEGQYGPWSLQNGEIEDSTGKMKITFNGMPSQENLKGKTMIFKSTEGKHGLKGVSVKTEEYQGKTYINLIVHKTALIVTELEEPNVQAVTPSPRAQEPAPSYAPEPVSHDDRKLGLATTKNRLTQLAGLYDLCWKTVQALEVYEDNNDGSLKYSDFKDIATTLFIQASRDGLADKMPIRTTSKFYNEEAIRPQEPGNPGSPMEDEGPMEDDRDHPF